MCTASVWITHDTPYNEHAVQSLVTLSCLEKNDKKVCTCSVETLFLFLSISTLWLVSPRGQSPRHAGRTALATAAGPSPQHGATRAGQAAFAASASQFSPWSQLPLAKPSGFPPPSANPVLVPVFERRMKPALLSHLAEDKQLPDMDPAAEVTVPEKGRDPG